jgi:hypothetical protein
MTRRGGRPNKPGARHACGKLKQGQHDGADIRAPTLWRRIKDTVVAAGAHPYAGTALGKLSLFGVLSDAEVAAGFRVGEIVGRYHRLVTGAKPYTVASPAYEKGFGAAVDGDEMGDEATIGRAQERARRARKAYERMMRHVPPGGAEAVLIALCIEDKEPSSLIHGQVKELLGRLAREFGMARN